MFVGVLFLLPRLFPCVVLCFVGSVAVCGVRVVVLCLFLLLLLLYALTYC